MGASSKQLNDYASMNTKKMNSAKSLFTEAEKEEKLRKAAEYYENNAKPGSIAANANLVKKYNEKNNK